MAILYMAEPGSAAQWRQAFHESAPELEFREWPEVGDARDIEYLIAWKAMPRLMAQFPNLSVLYSAGAGVDQFDLSELPEHVSLVRLVDGAMADIMAEYVTFAVLALHRDILTYQNSQRERRWAPLPIIPACERRVGVMGLGNLGQVALQRLQPWPNWTCPISQHIRWSSKALANGPTRARVLARLKPRCSSPCPKLTGQPTPPSLQAVMGLTVAQGAA